MTKLYAYWWQPEDPGTVKLLPRKGPLVRIPSGRDAFIGDYSALPYDGGWVVTRGIAAVLLHQFRQQQPYEVQEVV
jgi:hypothetical protein